MTTIVVFFNLKPGVSEQDYQAWVRGFDLPLVNAFKSVDEFRVQKATGLLAGGPSPYQYVELIEVADMETFFKEASTPDMKANAARFREFADNPIFVVTDRLS